MCCPPLARITSGLVSVKPGIPPGLTDKETIHGQGARQDCPQLEETHSRPRKGRHQAKHRSFNAPRQDGASVSEIVEVTDWQPHSVRGFFAGAVKRRLGIEVISENGEDGVRRYFVAPLRS